MKIKLPARFSRIFIPLFLIFSVPAPVPGDPMYSPSWGFHIDPPEGYEYRDGNGSDRFSFASPLGTFLDLVVYKDTYSSVEETAADAGRRIGNRGETSSFAYRDKKACIIELAFSGTGENLEGWGLCVELDPGGSGKAPLLLALAYGPAGRDDLAVFHLSALDSIAPSAAERLYPGPVTEFSYPRGELRETPLAAEGGNALIAEHDAEAAQALADREFNLLVNYLSTPLVMDAWTRFYRVVYRDSWDRIADTAFTLERRWNAAQNEPVRDGPERNAAAGTGQGGTEQAGPARNGAERDFAAKVLGWVQSFAYERNLMGSDFVNLVSAAVEGRGDCDSRAMLWAIVLKQAGIPSAIMISPRFSHAAGLADIPGPGARFTAGDKQWLIAETTAPVDIGLIARDMSVAEHWFAILFE
jgi:hypothetical protein